MMSGKTILILPDAHAAAGCDNNRFEWLGHYLLDIKPDIFLCLGDFADMPSLSSYDKGTRGFEGRRYKKDVEVTHDALQKLFGPLKEYNKQRARNKKQQYSPETVLVLGNHEGRIDKATQVHPELHETIKIEDLGYSGYFQKIVPYKDIVLVEGFAVSHYFVSGLMGRPIGGERAAHNLLNKQGMSCISGHSHLLDMAARTKADGQKMMGLVAGCYTHPEAIEGWNANTAALWWNGVVLLEDVADGWAEKVTFVSQKTLEGMYGN